MNDCPPYRPFRGARPPHFVDRPDDDGLSSCTITGGSIAAYMRGPTDPRFHRLVTGAPKLGKSASLGAISRVAGQRLGWVVVYHQCRPKQGALPRLKADVMAAAAHRWPRRCPLWGHTTGCAPSPWQIAPAPEQVGALRAGSLRAAALRHPSAPWSELRSALESVGRVAEESGAGLLMALDDVDLLPGGEAEALGHMARDLARAALPVALLMSCGVDMAERFGRSGNFSGTLWPTHLESFDECEAREALVVPASDRGVEFEGEALEIACAVAGGSPLELQRLGFAAWPRSRQARVVTALDMELAVGPLAPRLAS